MGLSSRVLPRKSKTNGLISPPCYAAILHNQDCSPLSIWSSSHFIVIHWSHSSNLYPDSLQSVFLQHLVILYIFPQQGPISINPAFRLPPYPVVLGQHLSIMCHFRHFVKLNSFPQQWQLTHINPVHILCNTDRIFTNVPLHAFCHIRFYLTVWRIRPISPLSILLLETPCSSVSHNFYPI